MRSPDQFVDEYGPRSASRLFSLYTICFAWYVFAIILLQTLGVEPLYMQLTPFYANLFPASRIGGVTTAAFLLGLILFAVLRRAGGAPISRHIRFGMLVVAVTMLLALQLVAVLARTETTLGEFWADFRWHLPMLIVVTAAATAAVRWLRRVNWWEDELSNKTAWRVAIALSIFAFALAGSVAMIRGGFDGIAEAYSRGSYEYVDDIGKGVSILGLLRTYNEIHPMLSMHAKVHPPGPVVILWVMSSFLLTRDALVLSIGTMAVGSLAVLPLFAWVRDMTNQRVALTCCAFYALVPSIVMFTATSADILFMPMVFLTLLYFWRAVHRNSPRYAIGAGIMYALLSLSSFSLLTLGSFFAFVGLWRLSASTTRASVIKTAVVMLASFLLFHGAVRLLTGFDVIECFRLSHAQFLEDQVNVDKTQPRYPSWAFKFFNPLCWIFYAGIPTSLLFLWRVWKPSSASKPLFIVFLLTLFVLSPLYLARGEGERSAMYVFPFIVIPAAHLLDELGVKARSLQPLAMTFAFLLFQTWLMESYLYTFW
ncbi:MAG: glycosyltransferase family 39 protein [Candidatus Hydrogenedentes bacterium]|nr:glycosyltransferase family 39 protein [Candidatus Hydrogenedentota bacterium]